jgi:proline iminopeptidase
VPGWGKLAWSIAVAPRGQDGSWITFDLRVDAFGPDAWRRFVRYWTLIGPFSRAIRRALFRRYRAVLGAAPPENSQLLPSDEVLPSAGEQITHSVFIEAPPARVWPWLVQMGCRRGGWYSWDQLDNAGVPSADRVIPNLQHIAVGDILPATPQGDDGFAVLRVDPERELTLGSPNLLPGGKSWGTPYDATWSFDLEPVGSDATRLIVRTRATLQPGAKTKVMSAVMPLLHDFMERKQLRTLKQRIEA